MIIMVFSDEGNAIDDIDFEEIRLLLDGWGWEDENDPKLKEASDAYEHLSRLLKQYDEERAK